MSIFHLDVIYRLDLNLWFSNNQNWIFNKYHILKIKPYSYVWVFSFHPTLNTQYPYRKWELSFISFVTAEKQKQHKPSKINTGNNTLFKSIIQGITAYFATWKKVGLKTIKPTRSWSKKAFPIIPWGKSDPDLGKRHLFTSVFPFLGVMFEVLCNAISKSSQTERSSDLWKHMLPQQNSEAQKHIQS